MAFCNRKRILMAEPEAKRASICTHQNHERSIRSSCKTTIEDLPDKTLINILSKLSSKSVFRCKCVCKTWREIISDPEFAAVHSVRPASSRPREILLRSDSPGSLSRTLFLLDLDVPKPFAEFLLPLTEEFAMFGFSIVNSCNGLICLCNNFVRNPAVVCNPITREYVEILRSERRNSEKNFINLIDCECGFCLLCDKVESEKRLVGSGFGFSPRTKEYKVLQVFDQRCNHRFEDSFSSRRTAEVYTLNKGTWRSIGFVPQIPHSFLSATCLKEKIFWVCSDNGRFHFIVSFDLDTDQFEFVLPPPYFNASQKLTSKIRMQELGGCLSLSDFSSAKKFDIWLYKEFGNGGRKFWTKSYVIFMCHENIMEPIKILTDEEILMFIGSRALVSYNCKEMKIRWKRISGVQSYFVASLFVPNFVSLKEILNNEEVVDY